MPIEPVVHTTQTVRPTGEAERERPDGHSSRRDDGRRQHEEHAPHDEAHPIPNDRGEITGKIIDVTA